MWFLSRKANWIQAFDINIYQSIASHLTYWADEDVGHFIISQLLARHRVFKGEGEEGKKP
jgi:hypothetical protein